MNHFFFNKEGTNYFGFFPVNIIDTDIRRKYKFKQPKQNKNVTKIIIAAMEKSIV